MSVDKRKKVDAMHMNKVEICGVNTSKLPVLTNEEMRALFEKSIRVTRAPGKNL